MIPLLQQIKTRRQALGLKQNDMLLRIGVSRQQYQRLEAKGNPRLDTLELIARGLNSELMLIPSEKISDVMAVLAAANKAGLTDKQAGQERKSIADDPWQELLGEGV